MRTPDADMSLDNEPEKESSLANLLLSHLQEAFREGFATWLSDTELKITSTGENDDETWNFTCSQQDVEYKDDRMHHELTFTAKHGHGEHSKIPLYFRLNVDGQDIKVKIRSGGSRGKWKGFPLCTVIKTDRDQGVVDEDTRTMTYRNRTFSQNIRKVWFPEKTRIENTTLQIPLQLSHSLPSSDGWAQFTDEGLRVSIPSAEINVNEDGAAISTDESQWYPAIFSFITYYIVCNVYALKNKYAILRTEDGEIPAGFPPIEGYKAERPVNLNPADVIKALQNGDSNRPSLYFPWHVIEAACSALNAGKNIIFTGPPGCGKSKLAGFLARMATGRSPLMSTASPAWTSGDLIGRYHPKPDGNGLEFKEGFFLRSINPDEQMRWLIVDEFNRADIDACFGELFSVLAGDTAELPFQHFVPGESENDDEGKFKDIRIIPGTSEDVTDADYLVPEEFRLIGTMNDADRSGLNDLSFALLRRFAIIPVEPPSKSVLEDLVIKERIDRTKDNLQLDQYAWDVGESKSHRCQLENITDVFNRLFADEDGLISNRVVGVASVADIIRFVGEGIRAPTDKVNLRRSEELKQLDKKKYRLDGPKKKKPDSDERTPLSSLEKRSRVLVLSYLALGMVLQVFPQLEALSMNTSRDQNPLISAIGHIFDSIHIGVKEKDKLPMLRVTKSETGYELEVDQTIAEFLFQNLRKRFPHQAPEWRSHLSEYLS